MARDPLRSVQTVRQRVIEQARQALAICLQGEAIADARISAIDEAIRQDRTAHQAVENAFQFQEIFMRREQAWQAERAAAEASLTAAQARSAEARTAVAEARSAAEVVETLMTERQAAANAEADRRAQHVLDDIVRSRPGVRLAWGQQR